MNLYQILFETFSNKSIHNPMIEDRTHSLQTL